MKNPRRRMTAAAAIVLSSLLLIGGCAGKSVEVDADGGQRDAPDSRSATFVNLMSEGECNLYWIGTEGGGPRLYYGPLEPRGGERTVEGFPGQAFALTRAGTYDKLAEYTITEGYSQRFSLTDSQAANSRSDPPAKKAEASASRERTSAACRSSESCGECAGRDGCGWSVVRRACFRSHPVATANDAAECAEDIPAASSKSVEAWLNMATALILGHYGYGPRSLRDAFRALERGAEAAAEAEEAAKADTGAGGAARAKAASLSARKVNGALAELSAKLEAVFDDADAAELLASSRSAALAAIHPDMPMVERRTASEARAYIARGEPVVITNAFDGADEKTSPVAHKWTLEYLSRRVFGAPGAGAGGDAAGEEPSFNVAADREGPCCRYFEPQAKAQKAEYPYPFAPSTHLYRDQFDGFVKTVRKASRMKNSGTATNRKRVLHYLHEIVMNGQGEAVVAGGAAPPQLKADLDAVVVALEALAENQPFFGRFASAKVWLGQRGIVMPIHYDATDNLYVMAWGRKKAIISPPGQLDALYRYPNAHPLAGSSQVNLTAPDLTLHPHFQGADLREVVVGPGDVLYLPAWWWHQFEQPFEDTAALNVWSRDRDESPEASMRDMRVREHALSDQLEGSVEQLFGNEAGVVLGALAARGKGKSDDDDAASLDEQKLDRANEALHATAESWREQVARMPGGHPKAAQPAVDLVAEYLELTHRDVMQEQSWPDWKPGVGWDVSQIAVLPRDLRERCEPAPESSPFMSICG